jgi:hypothetical protein
MRLRVLDLDGSVAQQSALVGAELIDARDLGPRLRIVADKVAWQDLAMRLGSMRRGSLEQVEPEVTFYGSGDFHHLATALVARSPGPVTIIQFDNHPDWVRWPATNNCGGWVCRALALPNVARVITLGPSSGDLVRPGLQLANLGALQSGRLEVYPWRHSPSRVYRRKQSTPCAGYSRGYLHWRQLADLDWRAFLDDMVERLPTPDVWITIDKDVLAPSEAITNWDQGGMPLTHVLTALEVLADRCKIVGVDVCGEYSKPEFASAFQRVLAKFDHPVMAEPTAVELERNATTNAALLKCLRTVLK